MLTAENQKAPKGLRGALRLDFLCPAYDVLFFVFNQASVLQHAEHRAHRRVHLSSATVHTGVSKREHKGILRAKPENTVS